MKKPIRFAFKDWIFIQMDADKNMKEHFFRIEMPLSCLDELNEGDIDKYEIKLIISKRFTEDIIDNNRFKLWFFNKTNEALRRIKLVVSIENTDDEDVVLSDKTTNKFDIELFANCYSDDSNYFLSQKHFNDNDIIIQPDYDMPCFYKNGSIKIGSRVSPYRIAISDTAFIYDEENISRCSRAIFRFNCSHMNLEFMESDPQICDKIGEKIENIIVDGYLKSRPFLKLFFDINKYSYKFNIDWAYSEYDNGVEFYGFIDLCEVNNSKIKNCTNDTMIIELKKSQRESNKLDFSVSELYFALFSTTYELHYRLPDKSSAEAVPINSTMADGIPYYKIKVMKHVIELAELSYNSTTLNDYIISRLRRLTNRYTLRTNGMYIQFFVNVYLTKVNPEKSSKYGNYMCILTVSRVWRKLDMDDFVDMIDRVFRDASESSESGSHIVVRGIVLLGVYYEEAEPNYIKYLVGINAENASPEEYDYIKESDDLEQDTDSSSIIDNSSDDDDDDDDGSGSVIVSDPKEQKDENKPILQTDWDSLFNTRKRFINGHQKKESGDK